MKHFMPLLLVGVLATACQKEMTSTQPSAVPVSELSRAVLLSKSPINSLKNVSSIDLTQLVESKTSPSFTVSLQSFDGQPLKDGAAIQPNTTYKVVVEGERCSIYHENG